MPSFTGTGTRENKRPNPATIYTITALLALGAFMLDVHIPLGVAAGVPYVAVVLFALWNSSRFFPLLMAAVSSGVILLGWVLSPPGDEAWKVLANRGLALFAIWVTVLLSLQRRQADEAQSYSKDYLSAIVKMANEAIISIDEQHRVIQFNRGAEKIFGYAAAEVLGRPLGILMPQRFAEPHRGHIHTFAQGAEESRPMDQRSIVWGKRKDGNEFQAEVSISKILFRGQLRFTATLRDVSERIQLHTQLQQANQELEQRIAERTRELTHANQLLSQEIVQRRLTEEQLHQFNKNLEQRIKERTEALDHINARLKEEIAQTRQATGALRKSEEKSRALVSALPDLLIVYDKNGRYLDLKRPPESNDTLFTQDQLGKNVHEVLPAVLAGPMMDQIQDAWKTGSLQLFEYQRIEHGSARYFEARFLPYGDGLILSIIRDITARKKTERMLVKTIHEKEILIKEIHHRVKNNLQIISSLLSLQSNTIEESQTREALRESQSRLRSMSQIHELLYQSHEPTSVQFSPYARTLVDSLFRSYGINTQRIKVLFDTQDVKLDLPVAIPCGLILNELVSNCLKHAFPPEGTGTIRVHFSANEGRSILRVGDDGMGLSPNFHMENIKTLGISLITTLVKQIKGNMEVQNGNGTSVTIAFPCRTAMRGESKHAFDESIGR